MHFANLGHCLPVNISINISSQVFAKHTFACLSAAQNFCLDPVFGLPISHKSCNELFFKLLCLHQALFFSNEI